MVPNDTKEKIVTLARNHMMHLGYHSFNYKMIATELNIKNSAIHHYFPVKEDLGLAVIAKDKADFEAMAKGLEGKPAAAKLNAILSLYDTYFNTNKNLCLAGAFGSAYADIPEKLQLGSGENLTSVGAWLKQVLTEGKEAGKLKFDGTAEAVADLWVTLLTGSLIVGRLKGEAYFAGLQKTLKSTVGI